MAQRKSLGGSSSINGMLYVKGAPHRYDEWRDGIIQGGVIMSYYLTFVS